MLVEFCEVEKFLRNSLALTVGSGPGRSLRLIHLFQMRIFLVCNFKEIGQVSHTVVRFLFWAPYDPDESAAVASEYDCRTLVLMSEQLLVRKYICASFVAMATPEHYFAK